ncbi:MAG: hypothetical protein OXC68_15045 [Aestuariivita sp.]|nr:hypothetical protein [Aestuariivita sp.]
MVLKWLFGSRAGRGFQPGTETFPSLRVDAIGRDLRLEKRGARDAKAGLPASDAESLSSAEQDVVARVGDFRKKGLEYYENQIAVYINRIQGAVSDRNDVETEAKQFENRLNIEIRICGNHLNNAMTAVTGSDQKLKAYCVRHGVVGPPGKAKNTFLMVGVLLLLFVVEVGLSGILFSEKNEMGLVGGMGIAIIISGVNVVACLLCGFGSRYLNLKSFFSKILGIMAVLMFGIIFSGLNLTVAHFRDALEFHVWNTAGIQAIENLRNNVFGIDSFRSWVVAAFGAIVSVIAFIEGCLWKDRHPGYNHVFDAAENAVTHYAKQYEQGQFQLEEIYTVARDQLRNDAQRMYANVQSAVDAVGGQSTLSRQLETFLKTCDQTVNQLHARYREANEKIRSEPRPKYFDRAYSFEPYMVSDHLPDTDIEKARDEITKVDDIVEHSVKNLMEAQKSAISAFSTVEQLKQKLQGNMDDPNPEGVS